MKSALHLPDPKAAVRLRRQSECLCETAVNNIDAAVEAGGGSQELHQKLLNVFGAKRIMWNSIYPAHPRLGSLKSRLEACKLAFAFMSEEDCRWIFSDTALSVWPSLKGWNYRVEAGVKADPWPRDYDNLMLIPEVLKSIACSNDS